MSGRENPIALGGAAFRSVTPVCNTCHSTAPGVNLAGPTLAGIAARAEEVIASPDYKGEAKDVESFAPLSDDAALLSAMRDLVDATFV